MRSRYHLSQSDSLFRSSTVAGYAARGYDLRRGRLSSPAEVTPPAGASFGRQQMSSPVLPRPSIHGEGSRPGFSALDDKGSPSGDGRGMSRERRGPALSTALPGPWRVVARRTTRQRAGGAESG